MFCKNAWLLCKKIYIKDIFQKCLATLRKRFFYKVPGHFVNKPQSWNICKITLMVWLLCKNTRKNYILQKCLVTLQKYTQKLYFPKMSSYFAKRYAKTIFCKNFWLLCKHTQKIYFAKISGYMKKNSGKAIGNNDTIIIYS